MARAFTAISALVVVVLGFTAPAVAGPFEDGVAAYDKNDFANALRHWRPLADQGNPAAQSNIALMYAKGQGLPRDYVRAYMWSSLSAARGHQDGAKNRDTVAKGMTAAQIDQEQLTREWKPAGQPSR